MTRLFAVRSYDWWDPSCKRFVADDAIPFEEELIFPVAWRRGPATVKPTKRSDR